MATITGIHHHVAETTEPVTITLPDRLDVHSIHDVGLRVRRALDSGVADILIDGAAVKHVDQAGIEGLRDARRGVLARGGRCELVPSTALRVAFELVVGELLGDRPHYITLEAA